MDRERNNPSFWQASRERMQALRNVPALLKFVWEAGPPVVVSGVALRVVSALIPLGLLAITRLIIDDIVALVGHHAPLPGNFWWLVGFEFAVACVGGVVARVIDFTDNVLADGYMRTVTVRMMKHASQLDLPTYEDPVFRDKLERARVQARDRLATVQMIGQFLQQAVGAASMAVSILFFSPWLLAILIVGVIPAFMGESHYAFADYALNFQQTPIRRQIDYLFQLGASKESAKELKLFGLGEYLTGRARELYDRVYEERVGLARRKVWAVSALSILTAAGYYTAFALVVYWTVTGAMSVGTLTFLLGAIAGASTNVQMMFSTFSGIADQALFLKDLLDFFAQRPSLRVVEHPTPAPRPIQRGFEFENVSFTYPGGSEPVLRGLRLRINAGERIALIGENGQGKTTIVKLLTRLYDPSEGRILLDGVDLREYDPKDLASEIGIIFQDFVQYEMTAAENIGIGRIGERDNLRRIQPAAIRTGADEVIRRLPRGYGQLLGRRFEGGVDLSGGEWQKVALARAYLRDAQVLVLDEPTASLDARSEHEVFQCFAELTQGKTALLISHRFSTVRMADRILVLEGGMVAEEGSHGQLMRLGQRYAEMFELQAASYR